MARRRTKRCKNGLRRDGKTCRKTKCRTYLTQRGYCAKAGGWYRPGRSSRKARGRASSRKRRKSRFEQLVDKYERILEVRDGIRTGKHVPLHRHPLIGDDPVSVRNYGHGASGRAVDYAERVQQATSRARPSTIPPLPHGWHVTPDDFYFGFEGVRGRRGRAGPGGRGPGARINLAPQRQGSLF